METSPIKVCRVCGTPKVLAGFATVKGKNGKVYPRSRCKVCDSARSGHYQKQNRQGINVRRAQQRASGVHPEKYILQDSRKSDKLARRVNDLNTDFIHDLIQQGCSYCGETELRMTLDRMDNLRGHTQDNVVPACIRCNYTRKDMPYEAWLQVAPGMRAAREQGLFQGWTGRVK